ncbi:MAG: DUF4363 family protein [Ruminococcaceae bacterium]|nr:DUF4363 family protein [Oscillospiraceae bacterium]
MNRLAVSIAILSVMAAGCGVSVWATDKVAADMMEQVELTEKAFTDGDTAACTAHAEQLDGIWDGVMKYSILITDLGHALEITSSIAEIRSFAEEQNDELYAACDRAQAQISMFREMQMPTLWKIL